MSTAARQAAFLAEYSKSANLSNAARAAHVNRNSHYQWMEDPEYEARFCAAFKEACDSIDNEIHRRGAEGYLEPVFYQGKKVANIRKYDPTLLIFFAKGLMPEKYRENLKADITSNATVRHIPPDLEKLSDTELDQLEALLLRATGNKGADEPRSGPGGEGGTGEEQDPDILSE